MTDSRGPEIRRKLYRRGSSFETTIPMPLLFTIDTSKKRNVLFRLDKETNRWYIGFEQIGDAARKTGSKKTEKKKVN